MLDLQAVAVYYIQEMSSKLQQKICLADDAATLCGTYAYGIKIRTR